MFGEWCEALEQFFLFIALSFVPKGNGNSLMLSARYRMEEVNNFKMFKKIFHHTFWIFQSELWF